MPDDLYDIDRVVRLHLSSLGVQFNHGREHQARANKHVLQSNDVSSVNSNSSAIFTD
jgi:hypothetical protein